MTESRKMLGNMLLLLTAVIWGTAFVFQRVGMDSIEPVTFNAARMWLAAAAIGLVAVFTAEKSLQDDTLNTGFTTDSTLDTALADRQDKLQSEVETIKKNMVTKSDLSDLIKLFESGISNEEVLILNGEPFKADRAYQKIYKKAQENIIMVDDYLGIKTLHHLSHAEITVDVTIISDNKGYNPLRLTEYNDFLTEYPGRNITFRKSVNKVHDRYIVLDYGTKTMKVYHCGASSKDAGKKITTITEIKGGDVYRDIIKSLLTNPLLTLN